MSKSQGEGGEVNSSDSLLISLSWEGILGLDACCLPKPLAKTCGAHIRAQSSRSLHALTRLGTHKCAHIHTHTQQACGAQATAPIPASTLSHPARVLRSTAKEPRVINPPAECSLWPGAFSRERFIDSLLELRPSSPKCRGA